MISAALITGLTGKRPGLHRANTGQSHPLCHMGPGALARYMPFVYTLVVIERYSAANSVCDVRLNNRFFCSSVSLPIHPFLTPSFPSGLERVLISSLIAAPDWVGTTESGALYYHQPRGRRTLLITCLMHRINHLWTSYRRTHLL